MEPGSIIGSYSVGTELGQGPLASTWLLEGAKGTPEAVLRVLLLRRPDFQERFTSAAKLLMRRAHTNLVQLRELVTVDSHVGVVTEYVEGGNLLSWISNGARAAHRVVPTFYEIARGVGAAHHSGLLHRNLKPTKILLTPHGRPKVAGFILGKVVNPVGPGVTDLDETFGTPQYMAPEQFRGASDADHRSDLFSLGCVLYQMLTGRRPFDHPDVMMVYKRMMTGEMDPLPASTPAALVGIVADLLDPDPALRPPSADALLERFLEDPELRRLLPAELAELGTDPDIVYDPHATVPPQPARDSEPERSVRTAHVAGVTALADSPVTGSVARTARRSGPPSLPPPPTKRLGNGATEDVPFLASTATHTEPPALARTPVEAAMPVEFSEEPPTFSQRVSSMVEGTWMWLLLGLTSLATTIVAVLFLVVYLLSEP